MPKAPYRPKELAWSLFRGSDATRTGLLTREQLRGSAWIRVRHDVYADSRLDRDHELACRAVLLRLPVQGVLAGPSAAFIHGVEHAANFTDNVHVVVPRSRYVGPAAGLKLHRTTLRTDDVRTGGGLPSTTPVRTAWELAAWLQPLNAVPVIDTMLAQNLVTSSALAAVGSRYRDRLGGRRAAMTLTLVDAGAQSPPESQLRVKLVLAGLPRPVTQHPVQLSGDVVVHPDLAWPIYRVAVEYDGRWHHDPDQLHRDRRRLNQLVSAGWLVLHVTSRRLHGEFDQVLREVKQALRSRGWRP